MVAVLVDEVVRRNRRRIAAITAAAAVNYWLVVTFLAWFFLWGLIEEDHGITELWTSTAAGAVVATVIVGTHLRSIRPRTAHRTLWLLGVDQQTRRSLSRPASSRG